jgi:putative transposase
MPKGLRRFHHTGDWHFITCSCYHRQKFLESVRRRDLFLDILEQVRAKYEFVVAAYVVMPEHFHLLIGEPRVARLYTAMQVLKQRVSLRRRGKKRKSANQIRLWEDATPPAFWQPRYYDFNVFTRKKYIEELRYLHRNPVKRGLVSSPELWGWSSYRDYWLGEAGKVKIRN